MFVWMQAKEQKPCEILSGFLQAVNALQVVHAVKAVQAETPLHAEMAVPAEQVVDVLKAVDNVYSGCHSDRGEYRK